MLLDAYSVPTDDTVHADVCIVGAGPAGITLAQEFAGEDFKVLLLEGGRFEFDPTVQSLHDARAVSDYYLPSAPLSGRRRQFGGTTNLWDHHTRPGDGRLRARMMMAEEIDFEHRDAIPYSGWPFQRSTLMPYYERAQAVCQLGPLGYGVDAWSGPDAQPISFPGSRLNTVIGQFVASDVFTHRYRDDLVLAENVTLCISANVVGIEVGNGPVAAHRVRVATLAGSQFWVEAACFVLAAGALENTRLLLSSDGASPAGIGNEHDLVGRFLMDHQAFRLGVVHPSSRELFKSLALYDARRVGPWMVGGSLTLDESVVRDEGLLNMCAVLAASPKGSGSSAEQSLKWLYGLRRGGLSRDVGKHLVRVVLGADKAVAALWTRGMRRDSAFGEFRGGWSQARKDEQKLLDVLEVLVCCEQVPDPDNRVVLAHERDRLGRRKLELHLSWNEQDKRSIRRGREILAEEFGNARIGRFQPWVDLDGPARPLWPGIHHPMGTTRMHPDPAQGVVDEDCRVHSVPNLFVAGSSVFPTGLGYANPTFTLLALTLRLADHIKTVMASAPKVAALQG
jgi:choline dehydrogenase-like flavoprotein